MNKHIETLNGQPVIIDYSQWDRIREQSPEHVNTVIEKNIENSVRAYGAKGNLAISDRIDRLEHEWDIDRTIMVGIGISNIILQILSIGRPKSIFRKLAFLQMPFLVYHAFRGWMPPVSVLRRLLVRSNKEIDAEKYALKTIRGDFHA